MIRFTKAKPKPKMKPKPKGSKKATLNKLKSFLTTTEPEVVEFLVSFWNTQAQGVTYKELREAYLSGGITEKQFIKWQKDYAKLVDSVFAPKWKQAADSAAAEVKAQYSYFVYEPSVSTSVDFLKKHGAELVTNLVKEQKDALNAIIVHVSGYTAVTPDEAARIIRPVIGLTKPQVIANARYREAVKDAYLKAHPNCKPGTAKKKAAEAAARYAARQHRYRAQSIARTELAYGYNAGAYGATKDAQLQGYIGDCRKVWLTAYDERVCPICSQMDDEKRNMDELFSNGKMLPPGHPQCRCAVAYEEIPETNLNSALQSGIIDENKDQLQQQDIISSESQIPPNINMPDGMTYKEPAHLGGTGEMHIYTDAEGKEWLFKPAQSKSGIYEPFRAYSQEAGYKVQGIVNPDTAVPVGTGTLGDKFGTFQQRINTVNGKDFKLWQHGKGTLTDDELEAFQREHVTDWLLGNFDSHGGNFVTDMSGRVIGIDKEQAFKYMSDKASRKMNYTYHPNAKYGETEPIYNTMFRKYAQGDIELDLNTSLKYIQRVEAIPDVEYREIFREYAESLYGKGAKADELLNAIVERKSSLRETYRDFYSALETERTGTKTVFQFSDEIAGTVTSKPVPKPKASVKPKTLKTPAKTEGGYKVSEVLDDMSVLPMNQNGVAIHSDGGMLEQMNLTGHRVTIDSLDYYEIFGKLTEETWEVAVKNAKQRGYSSKMDFLIRNADGTYSTGNVGMQLDASKIMTLDQGTFEVYSDYISKEQYSMGGFFRIRVPATGNAAADRKAMEEIIDKAGLRSLTVDPTDAEELLLKKTRIAWQRDPAAFEKCRYLTGSVKQQEIDKILAKAGLDDKRIQGMTLKEVFPGYSTYVDDAALMEYKKAGLTHVWVGVDSADSMVAICKSDGFTATNYRITAGMKKCGASPAADMRSGGADNVFTRLGCKVDMDYQMSFLGEDYRVIISPEVMNRTDWYAHRGDSYGVAKLDDPRWKKRLGTTEFIKSETGSTYDFTCSNEILFRHGIGTDQFVGISCQDECRRQILLEKFKDAGVTEFNGVPIDEFVTVTKKVGEDSMRGVQGLSYYDKDVSF